MMMIKQICYFLASLLVVLSTYEPPVACHELAVADMDETVAEHFLSRILAVSAKRVTNMRTRTTKATKATKAAKAAKATKKVNKNSKKTKKTKKAKAAKTTKAKAAKKTTKKINATVVCGVPKITPITNGMKIVGGVNAIAGSIPWQASLVIDNSDGSFMCGGTLIDAQWIVTAGHCAASGDQVTAYLGIYNYSDTYSTGKGTIRTASKVIRHPKFNGNTVANDITLVKLSKAVTFTDKILPACLPTSDNATVGRAGMVSGWGLTKNNGDISDPLMQAVIPIQKLSWCGFSDTSVKLQICAGSSKSTKDTCQGDSGGPLTLTNNGKSFDLVGITSYGGPCNGKGIYTRVYGYISWIKSTMAAN